MASISLAYDFDIIYRPGKLNANADALSRLKPEFSKGPVLDDIIEDYYLSLNSVKHSCDSDEEERERTRSKAMIEENVCSNTDGMKNEEYFALMDYLTKWVFPSQATRHERIVLKTKDLKVNCIRRLMESFQEERC